MKKRSGVLVGLLLVGLLGTGSKAVIEGAEPDLKKARAAILAKGGVVRLRRGTRDQWEVGFHLRGQRLTDAGLTALAAMPNLVVLNLRDTQVTSKGLIHLADLKDLQELHLERTKIDDQGIRHLLGLQRLEYLNLYKTKITDKSLVHLAKLKQLRRLYVWQTKVTDKGVAQLKRALPKLKVIRGIDLSRFSDKFPDPNAKKFDPKLVLKWRPAGTMTKFPRSRTGEQTTILFVNQYKDPVKLYWVSYGGPLKLYAQLPAGAKRQQNSYSNNTWLITDLTDKPLGFFIILEEEAKAIVPKNAGS